MNLFKPTLLSAACLVVSFSTSAATFNYGDGGIAIQGVLDGITVQNPIDPIDPSDPNDANGNIPSSVDVTTDVFGNSGLWEVTATGGSYVTRIKGLPSNLFSNASFGVYDSTDTGKKVELLGSTSFATANNSAFDQAGLSIKDNGSVYNFFLDSGLDFAANRFGYYLDLDSSDANSDIFYSEKKLNQAEEDRIVTFQGNNEDRVKIGGNSAGLWTENEYILAWDVDGDKDFADFVVMVESVNNVPEPSTLFLYAMGLLGFRYINKIKVSQTI